MYRVEFIKKSLLVRMQLDIKKSNQPKEAGHFASFIETWGINAEVNNNDVVKPKSKSTHELFSKTRGMGKTVK
ncbi:hypothetical protein FACS1894123_05580 [Bacteroidia bacterium]|nr:hypothetical protein FACS1894123_05580 [Bacteroidia bacterium]